MVFGLRQRLSFEAHLSWCTPFGAKFIHWKYLSSPINIYDKEELTLQKFIDYSRLFEYLHVGNEKPERMKPFYDRTNATRVQTQT